MRRKRSNPLKPGTLGEALSMQDKDKLRQLRDTLQEQARNAIANQLATSKPPWRQRRGHSASPDGSRTQGMVRQSQEVTTASLHQPIELQTSVVGHGRNTHRPTDVPSHARVKPADSKTQPKKATVIATTGKSTFEFWDFPGEAAVREPPPTSISDVERSKFAEVLNTRAGSKSSSSEKLFAILGLDFGTSSTKMIVRFPYEPGEPTIGIPAPEPCRSGNHPYLWQTVLWLKDGVFTPWCVPGAAVLNSIKQGLIQGRGDKPLANLALTVNRDQVAVAYIAFAIRYANGWLLKNRPDIFRHREVTWFVNLGMPAASHDELTIIRPYRRIGAAALQLAKLDCPVTIEATRCFLDDPHVNRSAESEENAEELGVAVLPETAAEMTGFAKSTRGAPGLYLLIDVGAMTLDACMFNLVKISDTDHQFSLFRADVRPLGVDSLHWFLAEGKTPDQFEKQCSVMLRTIIFDTKAESNPHAEEWKEGHDLPILFAGGGASNLLHREVVNSLDLRMKEFTNNDGIRLLDLPVPTAIDLPVPIADFGRMAVAWGLSYPPTEIGRIRLPHEIEDVPKPDTIDWSGRLITKDQV